MRVLNVIRFILISLPIFLFSCKKDTKIPDEPVTPESNYTVVKFTMIPKNGTLPIIWDSISNTNAAGNQFSVNTINMYISNIWLKNSGGDWYKSNQVFYIDPSISAKSSFQLSDVPKADYVEVKFLVGLDSSRNVDSGLETTIDNLNMVWPTMMGGGYHFLKMEGHYIDATSISKGYAVHLGKDENLVNVTLPQSLSLQGNEHQCSIVFNVNEVFSTPYLYDLNAETNYTMSDSTAMSHIKSNLQNAFTISQNN